VQASNAPLREAEQKVWSECQKSWFNIQHYYYEDKDSKWHKVEVNNKSHANRWKQTWDPTKHIRIEDAEVRKSLAEFRQNYKIDRDFKAYNKIGLECFQLREISDCK